MAISFLGWLSDVWNDLSTYLISLPQAILDIGRDVVSWSLDGLLTLIEAAVASVPLPQGSMSSYWSSLPVEIAGMASLLGIAPAMGIVTAAMAVRFLLGAIPFVGWGR